MWNAKRLQPARGAAPSLRIVIGRALRNRLAIAMLMTAGLALLAYLYGAWLTGGLGFPLDDGWIHQTYARNLAATGRWTYHSGQVSAGSTSPLWTLLLSVGYVLGVDFRLWTYVLGFAAFLATIGAVYRLGRRLFPQRAAAAPLAALLTAAEWHLVWAAGSGMETPLFTALSLVLLDAFLRVDEHPRALFGIGLLGGLLTLTRPEGMVLLALVGLAALLQRYRFKALVALGLGFAVLIIPYMLFNRASGAGWLPNTFYAKQQEYAVLLAEPYLLRLARLVGTTWIGPQALLVPGFVWLAWRTTVGRSASGQWAVGGYRSLLTAHCPLVWWAAFLALYAWRLPVTYQHGRYLIPSIPILLLYGVAGTAALIRPASSRLWPRLIGRTVVGAVVAIALVFLARGAWAYVVDVQIINSEMVAAVTWLREHTPPDALVAAHDIGAVGYYAERPLIDLAGLVTPEVIPFMRDEAQLKAFIQAQKADYLVTFPGWYPQLTADACFTPVFQSDATWSPDAGGEHLVVYRTCW